jgi:plasmid maintenance system antidote protein VapI
MTAGHATGEKLKTKYLLDAALTKYKSDTGIAKKLGVSQSHVSRVRGGKKPMSPFFAAQLAVLLGHDPQHWAIVALRDQAKSPIEAGFWQSLLEKK